MQTDPAVIDYIRTLAAENYWGFLALKFEAGKITHIRREENLKPNQLPGRTGINYGQRENS